MSKDKVPENFPFDDARELFKKHEVTDVEEIETDPASGRVGRKRYDFADIFSGRPQADMDGLRKFLVEENSFASERIEKQLEKLQQGLNQGNKVRISLLKDQ